MNHFLTYPTLLLVALLTGCTTHQDHPMQAVSNVDIPRFMGDWYVIANIPTFAEREAVNPIERYQLNEDGTIATTFTFNRKHPDGAQKTLTMKGFVEDAPNNGIWRMQWIWPIKADYRIAHLDATYEHAIIGRNKRDYVWVLSRSSRIDSSKLEELLDIVAALGYDREKVRLTNWQQPGSNAALNPA